MPFLGIGLHVLVAIYFAIHAVRSGQQTYWLFILFSFPLLGSLVYFLAIYLPESGLDRKAHKVVTQAARSLDPGRELREARAAFDYTPTAQNQMRLAAALVEAGSPEEAATNYEACLKGPLASDPEIKFGAARAFIDGGQHARALSHLNDIRASDPAFRPEAISLLLARALAGAGEAAQARAEFESALSRFGTFETKVEYAIWASETGDTAKAASLRTDINEAMKRWNKGTRALNAHLVRRLQAATEAKRRQA